MTIADRVLRVSAATLTLIAAIALGGCGPSGPVRYNLSGQVTYGGQPVPAGSITFIPAAGNSGPAASVPIENGRYDTAPHDTGHVGGPHLVRITGLDGKASDDLFPNGMPLFPDFELEAELPKQDGEMSFEVPADWKPAPAAPAAGPTA